MDMNTLVERIVEEAVKKLKSFHEKRILALFCGGTIGAKEACQELKALSAVGYDCQIILSPAAEKVLGVDWLQSELGQMPIYTEKNGLKPGELLKNADTVLVPVLTLNSAAKVACGIGDTLVTNLMMQALFLGKPVIAAHNACNLDHPLRVELGMIQGNPKYSGLFAANLKILREYGINLVEAESLAAVVKGREREARAFCTSEANRGLIFNKRVLSAADIALCQGVTFRIGKNTLITPAARDLAEKRGISIMVS
ncbi:MAG: flavoprotein [Dehalobacterium sp.]